MDLERVAAVIRPRSSWEAADFGYAMVRRWWRGVYAAWMATTLPLWAAIYVALWDHPILALLLLWWLRPLFDRVPLFVLSRALFGATPRLAEVLRVAPRLLAGRAFAALVLHRLDPARSFALPILQLEGLTGAARRRRSAALRQGESEAPVLLTLACLGMELLMLPALFALAALLVPPNFAVPWGEMTGAFFTDRAPAGFQVLVGAVFFLAFSVVEPFYVGAGFALYLNRRTLTEGWDVDLAFRRLARRLEGLRRRAAGAAAMLVVAWAVGAAAAQGAGAPPAPPSGSDPAEAAARVLASPELGGQETVTRWRFRYLDELRRWLENRDDRADRAPAVPWAVLVARGLEVFLWALLGIAVVALALLVVRRTGFGFAGSPAAAAAGGEPAALFGLDLATASLPDDVPAAALGLWEEGRGAEALALLYRGALAVLAREVEISPSWTEQECLRHLARHLPREGERFLGTLAAAWLRAGYAHRLPSGDEVRALAAGWREHFGRAA